MRAYFFGNQYISSIQQGIQAGHVLSELFIKYNHYGYAGTSDCTMLYDWATDHKTMILLNGGYSETLRELYAFLSSEENPYPYANFHEGQDALDGALTSVGIILPEKIYGIDPKLVPDSVYFATHFFFPYNSEEYSQWETELIQRLSQFSLAR